MQLYLFVWTMMSKNHRKNALQLLTCWVFYQELAKIQHLHWKLVFRQRLPAHARLRYFHIDISVKCHGLMWTNFRQSFRQASYANVFHPITTLHIQMCHLLNMKVNQNPMHYLTCWFSIGSGTFSILLFYISAP